MRNLITPLLLWFSQNRENYFFREGRDPYRVWVSEVALQQTRISAALPLLKNFLQQYSSIAALASASEEQVIQAWSGLGYYNRARNLWQGAIYLRRHFNCQMPQEFTELKTIPSIGPYTAAAIASICYGKPILAVDGNVKRILARWFLWYEEISSLPFLQKVSQVAPLLLAAAPHPGDLNEALMEFGQKICTPRPLCQQCFLRQFCTAYSSGATHLLPNRKAARQPEELNWTVYLIEHKQKILLQKTVEPFPFLKNMFILPSEIHYKLTQKTISSFAKELVSPANPIIHPKIKHAIMHFKINGYLKQATLNTSTLPPNFQWVAKDKVEQYLNSSLMKKFYSTFKQLSNSWLMSLDSSNSHSIDNVGYECPTA